MGVRKIGTIAKVNILKCPRHNDIALPQVMLAWSTYYLFTRTFRLPVLPLSLVSVPSVLYIYKLCIHTHTRARAKIIRKVKNVLPYKNIY